MFVALADLPVRVKTVRLNKLEHRAEGYRAMSGGFAQVPILQEGDWALSESATIMRYLARTQLSSAMLPVPQHWYPHLARPCALVNSALDWANFGLRHWSRQYLWRAAPPPLGPQPRGPPAGCRTLPPPASACPQG